MTQTASRLKPGSGTVSPKLIRLLEQDELDWDNPDHRRAYLEAWIRHGDLLKDKRKEEHCLRATFS